MFNTQLLNWLDLAISNLSEGTCWLLKNISKRPSLISTNVSSWFALLTKVPLAGLQLRNMDLMTLPKILNTRRNFKWLSHVHMSKLTLSPPRTGFPAQGKSVSNTMHRKSSEKNMADNAASYRGRFCWRGVFLLQLGSQINFPNSQQEKTWRFHLKILSYHEFFECYASPFLNV